MSVNQEIWSDLAIHPGETLADFIDEHDLNHSQLAAKTGWSQRIIRDVVAGSQDITSEIAEALDRAFGLKAQFWLNLQKRYDQTLARNAAKSNAP